MVGCMPLGLSRRGDIQLQTSNILPDRPVENLQNINGTLKDKRTNIVIIKLEKDRTSMAIEGETDEGIHA